MGNHAQAIVAPAESPFDNMKMAQKYEMEMHGHDHGLAVPVSYSDLTKAAALPEKARRATEKYKDVHLAVADGYQAIGPDLPRMCIHYIGSKSGAGVDIEQPPILL
jgi:hypothetical protein